MKRSKHVDFRPGRRDWVVWLPTLLGVGVLLMMLVLAAHRLIAPPPDSIAVLPAPITPYRPAPVVPPPSSAAASPPTAPAATTPSPAAASATPSSRPAATATAKPSSRPVTGRPPPPVTGRYRVVDSYGDGFIGEVLISNRTAAPAGWVVELRFPAGVGDLNTSWVESAPQATQTRVGDTFVWHSGAPVDGGSSVALRFHFARHSGGDRPSICTVDGAPCH